jgi:hypothetical protein
VPVSTESLNGASSTWYPSTPDRAAHRRASGRTSMNVKDASEGGGLAGGEMTANASINMANIRGMDKLEIFFK